MPKNLELKAELFSAAKAKEILHNFGAIHVVTMNQTDTYFNSINGRLKLREIDGKDAEIIYYDRDEISQDRWSDYQIYKVSNSSLIKQIFEKTNGIKIVVEKERELYTFKNSRIHIDEVKGLGSFIEFEVLYENSEDQVKELFNELKKYFSAVIGGDNIRKSYSDLILEQG